MEVAHVQLTGSDATLRAVRDTVNRHRTRAADTFATVMIKGDWLITIGDELLRKDVEHFQKRGVLGNVGKLVLGEFPHVEAVLLAPNAESKIHCFFHRAY
jgi:hypothetical protein